MGMKDHPYIQHIADTLADAGYAAARFDFTNDVGKSEGRFEDLRFSGELEDLKTVIEYVSSLDEIDETRIALAGHSMGGVITIITAVQLNDSNIRCTISLSSPFRVDKERLLKFSIDKISLEEWKQAGYVKIKSPYMKSSYRLSYDFMAERESFLVEKYASQLKNHLVIHGDSDRGLPVEHAGKIYDCLQEPKKIVIIEGLTHFYKDIVALGKLEKEMIKWLDGYMK